MKLWIHEQERIAVGGVISEGCGACEKCGRYGREWSRVESRIARRDGKSTDRAVSAGVREKERRRVLGSAQSISWDAAFYNYPLRRIQTDSKVYRNGHLGDCESKTPSARHGTDACAVEALERRRRRHTPLSVPPHRASSSVSVLFAFRRSLSILMDS